MYPSWFPDTLPSPFGCGCALEYLFLCTSEHFCFHFQGSLHHPHQLHPNTLSLHNQQVLKLSNSHCHGIFKSVFIKMPLILNDKINRTSINQFGYLCGASYPSSRPLLPLIFFEALQSSAVFCHSRHTSNSLICVGYHQNNISISKTNYPHHTPISNNLFDHAMIYQWQKVIGIVPAAITPGFFFSSHDFVGHVILISGQLAPAHSWARCLLELHVHHCLGDPHHLLFPCIRGFPLLIATWRSQMVCLSLSAEFLV